jgi:hypothetical protein
MAKNMAGSSTGTAPCTETLRFPRQWRSTREGQAMDNRLLIVAGLMFVSPWIGMGVWHVWDKHGVVIKRVFWDTWEPVHYKVISVWMKVKQLWPTKEQKNEKQEHQDR